MSLPTRKSVTGIAFEHLQPHARQRSRRRARCLARPMWPSPSSAASDDGVGHATRRQACRRMPTSPSACGLSRRQCPVRACSAPPGRSRGPALAIGEPLVPAARHLTTSRIPLGQQRGQFAVLSQIPVPALVVRTRGSVRATMTPPCSVSATYCLSPIMYVIGVPSGCAGSNTVPRSAPVRLS